MIETANPLWHRSRALYEPGDIIQPGNWGRTLLGFGVGHGFFLRDYVLERIRTQEYLDKPSRLNATFGYVAQSCALRAFVDHNLYTVELVNPEAATHRGDINWIDWMPALKTFSELDTSARCYWAGTPANPQSDGFEIVSESPLRVIERVLSEVEQIVQDAKASHPQRDSADKNEVVTPFD